jgi:carboxyl-terminal processing protease
MKPQIRELFWVIVTIAILAPPVQGNDSSATLTPEQKILGLSLIWQEVNYSYAFFDRIPDVDWDSEYRNAIRRALKTESDYEYFREIQRFVALLREGHTNAVLPKEYRVRYGGHPPVELEEIDRKAVVINTSTGLAGTLPVGSVVVSVDDVPVDDYLAERVFPFMSASTEHYLWRRSIRGHMWNSVGLLIGEVGSQVTLSFETPAGELRHVTLERHALEEEIDWVHPPRSDAPILTFRWIESDIAYIALNTFNTEDIVTRFEEHLDELSEARAVVIDVRNNGGGNSRHGWDIGSHFTDSALEVSHWRTRMHIAAYKAWGKHSKDPEKQAHYNMNAWYEPTDFSRIEPAERGSFIVPVAVLIGSSTYSAAEDFLSFMRAVPNCVFVGGPSAGSTGQPLSFEIPGGAWVGITSKHDTMPDGTEFVGLGVRPDIEVNQTVAAFRDGRDLVLERAVRVLLDQLSD